MTVFSKLLFGSMHVTSYDWENVLQEFDVSNESNTSRPAGLRLAKVNADTILSAPCSTSILYPECGGNMHCFTALTSCAVLDVLGPPYSDNEGRTCTYYNVHPHTKFAGDTKNLPEDSNEYAWLEQRGKPEDLVVLGGKYEGPKI